MQNQYKKAADRTAIGNCWGRARVDFAALAPGRIHSNMFFKLFLPTITATLPDLPSPPSQKHVSSGWPYPRGISHPNRCNSRMLVSRRGVAIVLFPDSVMSLTSFKLFPEMCRRPERNGRAQALSTKECQLLFFANWRFQFLLQIGVRSKEAEQRLSHTLKNRQLELRLAALEETERVDLNSVRSVSTVAEGDRAGGGREGREPGEGARDPIDRPIDRSTPRIPRGEAIVAEESRSSWLRLSERQRPSWSSCTFLALWSNS